ncbi:MAG: acetylxylan esterase [Candidatus Sumerlaeaceae bacterium]
MFSITNLAAFLVCTSILRAADPYSIHVEPGVSGKLPAVEFSTTGSLVDVLTTFSVLTLETSGVLTTRHDLQTSAAQIQLPEVQEDTYIEVAVATGFEFAAEPFIWRTLARPEGKPLILYAGRKEMLPPPDFDEYWSRAKKELAAVPLKPVVTPVADKDTSTGLLFRVELPSVQDTTIVCWYYVPRAAFPSSGHPGTKKYPAVIIAPGYGAEEPPIDRTSDGYITCSVNPRNHGPSRAYWKAPIEHLIYNILDPENYYYKLAFIDCLRAAQFVFSRDEVDARRVATEGGSQGGLFAIATAALEPRIACVCANIPAFCDYPDSVILSLKERSIIRDLLNEAPTTSAQVSKTLSYVDGVSMITRLKAPVQINMGDQDPICPYLTGIVLYNRVPKGVPREFHVAPDCKHAVPLIMRQWNAAWYKHWLKQ